LGVALAFDLGRERPRRVASPVTESGRAEETASTARATASRTTAPNWLSFSPARRAIDRADLDDAPDFAGFDLEAPIVANALATLDASRLPRRPTEP
jgi:hypothetical protein